MKVNKNNYQELLLLYIDGELNIDAQKEVELFIEQNDFAKQELDLLLDTKLQLDEVSFGDISLLLKNENEEIGLNNYEEKFCLYVDNELTKNERKQVETFVLQHPTLQSSFTTLNKTKLPLQTIEYDNKKELYKKDKTIVFYVTRLVAAAVFIGFMAFVWNLFIDKKANEVVKIPTIKTEEKNNIINNKIESTTVKNSVVINKNSVENSINNKALIKDNKATKNELAVNKKIEMNTNKTANVVEQKNEVVVNEKTNNKQEIIVAKNNQPSNNQPQIFNSLANDKQTTKTEIAAVVYKNLDEDDDIKSNQTVPQKKSLLKKAISLINSQSNADNVSKKIFSVSL